MSDAGAFVCSPIPEAVVGGWAQTSKSRTAFCSGFGRYSDEFMGSPDPGSAQAENTGTVPPRNARPAPIKELGRRVK